MLPELGDGLVTLGGQVQYSGSTRQPVARLSSGPEVHCRKGIASGHGDSQEYRPARKWSFSYGHAETAAAPVH